MVSSPALKIYRGKEYVAACKYYEDAAALIAVSGGIVKSGHGGCILWRESLESFPAGESYDRAGEIMRERHQKFQRDGLRPSLRPA